jgi:hypothetical protein
MESHIKDVLSKLTRAVRLSCSGKVTSLRLRQYRKRKEALVAICNRIVHGGVGTDDGRPVVVALGAGGFSPSFGKGYFPGPVKAVRTALVRSGYQVIDVNEYNTSKLCYMCNEELIAMRGRNGSDVHAVRRCLNVECPSMTWDRDTNAALNILDISQQIERDGNRPAAFTRQVVRS